jgi:hypothetical protein
MQIANLDSARKPYDYSRHASNLADTLRKQAVRIRYSIKATVSAIIDIGNDLIAVKQRLEHGQFTAWVEAECGFTIRSAQKYMLAAEFAEDKSELSSFLSPNALYMLTAKSTPTSVATDIMARVEAGEAVTETTIKEMLETAKSDGYAVSSARAARRRAKLSPRTIKRHEAQERKREEIRRQIDEMLKAKATEIIARFNAEDLRFLLEIHRDRDLSFYHVFEHVESMLAARCAP